VEEKDMSYAVLAPICTRLEKPAQSQWSKVTFLFAAPWVFDALDRIAALGNLPPNWDGYGSPRIDMRSIAAARRFIANVAFENLPFPNISPVLGGSVGLHWRCGEREVEFTLHPDGTIEFLRVLGADLERDENMETGTLQYEPETAGLKLLLWMIGSR
jgi:hypothetical protein